MERRILGVTAWPPVFEVAEVPAEAEVAEGDGHARDRLSVGFELWLDMNPLDAPVACFWQDRRLSICCLVSY
jgi:hypothetical protein